MTKIFLSLFLLAALTTEVSADTICREPDTADFGSAVISRSSISFVITQGCAEDRLVAGTPVSLAVLVGQENDQADGGERTNLQSVWTVQFDFNSAVLDDSARQILAQVPTRSKVRVVGYTCQVGNEEYNLELSRQRAEAVAKYLRAQGVTIDSIEGLGECCPVSTVDQNKNRRVLIEEVSP